MMYLALQIFERTWPFVPVLGPLIPIQWILTGHHSHAGPVAALVMLGVGSFGRGALRGGADGESGFVEVVLASDRR